ncbi:MAG: hypothetical protein K6E91_04545 [Butyrivibrio sp.]|nr:hypothetical protein [Butyrivibrio sp.]
MIKIRPVSDLRNKFTDIENASDVDVDEKQNPDVDQVLAHFFSLFFISGTLQREEYGIVAK